MSCMRNGEEVREEEWVATFFLCAKVIVFDAETGSRVWMPDDSRFGMKHP